MTENNLKISNKSKSRWIYIYWIVMAVVIILEHYYTYPLWKRRELARRTIGIATIMGGAYPLAEAGVLDRRTWRAIFSAFGIAGAITSSLHLLRHSLEASETRKELVDDPNGPDLWEAWERRI